MARVKEPTFKINPNFRLTTKHLSVAWHYVDKLKIESESVLPMSDLFMFHDNGSVELLAQYYDGILNMIYYDATDFESKKTQKWLRGLLGGALQIQTSLQIILEFPFNPIGKDSQLAKVKDAIAMSPYYNYYLYLTKNQ